MSDKTTEPAVPTSVAAALDAAFDLSTWVACINWRARDKDNTGEWLDELKEKIEAAQTAIIAARKEMANG